MRVWEACLLVALSVAGCALRPGDVDPAHPDLGPLAGTIKNSAMNADEVRELQAQPATEQRRRLDAVLISYPDDLLARFLRTQAEVKLRDEAAVDVDSQLVLANPSLDRTLRLWVMDWRAEALVDLRRFDESIAVADQALEIDASSAGALGARGWARFFIDQPDGALADLDRALQAEPNEGLLYYRRARVLDEQGKVDLAAKDFERAIELAPDDGPSHREYGVLLYQTHDLERALAQFDAGARLMPGDPLVLAWHEQANFALERFDAAAADDHRVDHLGVAKQVLANAFVNVGVNLQDQHDFAGAAREFGRSLALQFDQRVANSLARMQWYSGQFGQAVESFSGHGESPVWDDYKSIGLFVVRGRANPANEPAAKVELASRVQPHQPHAWTDTLVSVLLGKTTLEAALAEADAAGTQELKAGRRCEADYYAAEQLLMHEQVASASRLLEEAYWVCPSTYTEAIGVIAERGLIAAKSPAH